MGEDEIRPPFDDEFCNRDAERDDRLDGWGTRPSVSGVPLQLHAASRTSLRQTEAGPAGCSWFNHGLHGMLTPMISA